MSNFDLTWRRSRRQKFGRLCEPMPNQDLALLKNTLVAEILTKDEDVARKELAFLQHRIQDFPIQEQNFGLIHFDFENKRIYD